MDRVYSCFDLSRLIHSSFISLAIFSCTKGESQPCVIPIEECIYYIISEILLSKNTDFELKHDLNSDYTILISDTLLWRRNVLNKKNTKENEYDIWELFLCPDCELHTQDTALLSEEIVKGISERLGRELKLMYNSNGADGNNAILMFSNVYRTYDFRVCIVQSQLSVREWASELIYIFEMNGDSIRLKDRIHLY